MVALVTAAVDQAVKFWLLTASICRGAGGWCSPPFSTSCSPGIPASATACSRRTGPLGQWALFALKMLAVVLLGVWLARTGSRLSAVALGLIIGGAIGNALDRAIHGAVMDFVLFHVTTASGASTGTFSTWPTWRSLPGLSGYCMNRCSPGTPQKRPERHLGGVVGEIANVLRHLKPRLFGKLYGEKPCLVIFCNRSRASAVLVAAVRSVSRSCGQQRSSLRRR